MRKNLDWWSKLTSKTLMTKFIEKFENIISGLLGLCNDLNQLENYQTMPWTLAPQQSSATMYY